MDIVAHALWTGAGALAVRRKIHRRIPVVATALWGAFPDVFAFGPAVAAGLWFLLANGHAPGHGERLHIGLPLYPMSHSLLVFGAVYGLVSLIGRRPVIGMLGWLVHILIDIPTHSFDYYATRIFWPLSNWGLDGLPWWTPWFWITTYAALAIVYSLMWRNGWFHRASRMEPVEVARGARP
jgi:hypothetical protein